MTGRNGEDCIVRVPLGTIVTERMSRDNDDVWSTLFDDFVDDEDDDMVDTNKHIENKNNIINTNSTSNSHNMNSSSVTRKDKKCQSASNDDNKTIDIDPSNNQLHNNNTNKNTLIDDTNHLTNTLTDLSEQTDPVELIKIDLDLHNSYVAVAYGGKAGVGNANLKRLGSSRLGRKSIPTTAMPGEIGEKKSLELELKIIADVGLVGMPNVSN
jgi:GTPase involved in cell partitioning and DNA repair